MRACRAALRQIFVTEKASGLAVSTGKRPCREDRLHATITVSIEDRKLAGRVTRQVKDALDAQATQIESGLVRVVCVQRISDIDVATMAGAVVVVPVTARNHRRLPEFVSVLREARPLGVQLVWDGVTPSREDVEQSIFLVLERAREKRKGPPVVLAKSERPVFALLLAIQETRQETR
ncbi:MAG: hypothetical protein FWD69_06670 [Polyangiaceae bacterium]|nr:hypothetical protein [Polyangiaceae bacterium]